MRAVKWEIHYCCMSEDEKAFKGTQFYVIAELYYMVFILPHLSL